MTMLAAVEMPNYCANSACRNRPGEGRFVLMQTGEPVVGGHRDLRLWMCAPCADALRTLVNRRDPL
ncbi:hypothetical protein [Amycolatopsis sp. PS_44_ISF1]|uniref:hypothetical protein n=1 Tax=Amycolatopsis sp. PS_44_ISF1 TaxID=2974917 RepID=UPI0028DFE6C1|nr:hypothetical protein [Amycolatopsis sp. PS_44_ISF1]MDT8915812.1 hypothetical protein [Amycolatopsis sp. PS_44_ISF1]